jgi:trehalose 6-phosphate phosphatase
MAPDDPLQVFLDRVERAPRRALLLDYDGTLAPFQVDRGRAVPYEGIREILGQILRAGHSRVVLIWGAHGWECLRPDGTRLLVPVEPILRRVLADAFEAMKAEDLADHCECKPGSVALHWRGLDATKRQRMRQVAEARWGPPAAEHGLRLSPFDGGLELRLPGRDKGSVVRELLAELPPQAAVAYLGDDQTDEDAFAAIETRGLGILVRSERRPTAASAYLKPPEELLGFLTGWHERAARSCPAT